MAQKPPAKKQATKKGPTMIQRSRAVSPASKAAWNHPARKFFGLTQREIDAITKFSGTRVQMNLNRISRA